MVRCPKCNNFDVSGPRYFKNYFYEGLRYTCNRCGYSKDEPTDDAKKEGGYIPHALRAKR